MLRIPPAFNTASPPEKDIEEGTPLPAPRENPLDQAENEAIQRRNDRVERRQIPESYRLDPPDEFQFPPKRVVEQSDQTGGADPVVPVPDPEMEDLSGTPPYPPDLSGTPPIPPPTEARSEDGSELPEQVEFPVDTGSDGWEGWDEYPLGGEQSGDEQSPEPRPQFEKKRKMKEKGEYTQKKQRGTADTTESESEVEEDLLGLSQPSDQHDASYRPYQITAREKIERTANR